MKKLSLSIILLLAIGSVLAQEPLSMSEAVGRGLSNNYSIQIAALDQSVAANNNDWGAAGRYPTLTFSLPGTFNRSQNPGSFLAGRQNLNGNLALDWVLFDGFAIQANKARFALLEEQSAGNAAVVIENNVQAIVLAYQNVLLAEAQLNVLEEVLESSKERAAYESYRRDLGTGSTFELLQFQTAVLTDSTNVISQLLNVRNTRRNINMLMGDPVDKVFIFTDSLATNYQMYDLADLEDRMLASNNSLQNQYLNQRLRAEETRLAKAALYPTVGINANANYSYGVVNLRNRDPDTQEEFPIIPNQVSAFDYTAGFSIRFNLYNGGNVKRQIENAQINQEIALLQRDELALNLKNELSVQFDNYRARRELLALQTENQRLANENLALATERFQSGLMNSLDYRTIQLQSLNAQFGRLTALRDIKESETEIIRLIGGLIR
ncbi:MAG: TolC family protein [Bacteroidia bacterium]